jgi:hypothetical protein
MPNSALDFCYIELIRDSVIPEYQSQISDRDRITFADIPEDVTVTDIANYNQEHIQGRSEPWVAYEHGECTLVTFTGKFIAEGGTKAVDPLSAYAGMALGYAARFGGRSPTLQNNDALGGAFPAALGVVGNVLSLINGNTIAYAPHWIWQEVQLKVAWLRALTKPQYDYSGRVYPPPLVRLNIGTTVQANGVMKSLVTSFHAPWEVNTLQSYYATCAITFQEINSPPKGYWQVRNGVTMPLYPYLHEISADQRLPWDSWQNAQNYAQSTFGL